MLRHHCRPYHSPGHAGPVQASARESPCGRRRPIVRRLAGALLPVLLLASTVGCGPAQDKYGFDSPAPEGSQLPHLTTESDGRPVLSWVEPAEDGHRLVYAVLEDAGWEPGIAVAEGSDWFVNWADIPSVQPLDDQLWAAHWLVKQPGDMYSYDIALSLSRDGGATWGESFSPHRDGTPTEHGFVSLWPARLDDDRVGVGALWLDGRHTLLDTSRSEEQEPRMMLRSAVFDAAGDEVSAASVDERVCDCCQTDVAITAEGPVVAYRGRSAEEVRDIQAARGTPAGWQPLGKVADDQWVIDGCPVNGPAIDSANDTVVVAWYTEADGQRRVQLVRQSGADPAWSESRVVDADAPLGRVDVALLANGDAAVSWLTQAEDGGAWVMVARVDAAGVLGEAVRVAATDASRPAGFPRMIRHDDALLLAWTRWQEGVSRVVTARVNQSYL